MDNEIEINLGEDEYFYETELNNAKDLHKEFHKCYINRAFENETANITDTCIENMDTKENTSKNLNNITCNENMDTTENTSKNLNNDVCNENMDEMANTSENLDSAKLDVKDKCIDEHREAFNSIREDINKIRVTMNEYFSLQASMFDEKLQSKFKHEKIIFNEDNKVYNYRHKEYIRVIKCCNPYKFGIIVGRNAKTLHYLQNKYNVDIAIPDPENCKEFPQIILIKYNKNEEEFDNAIKEIKDILDN